MTYKFAAYDLFGPMRHSTPEEQRLYREMLDKHSISLGGGSILNIEISHCDICHKKTQVNRKYYYYPIDCDCCVGQYHFEIIKHCKDCAPEPPKKISVIMNPIEKRNKINPSDWEYYD